MCEVCGGSSLLCCGAETGSARSVPVVPSDPANAVTTRIIGTCSHDRPCRTEGATAEQTAALAPRRYVALDVLTSTRQRIAPILVGHTVKVLLAEVGQPGRDRDALQRATLERRVDGE